MNVGRALLAADATLWHETPMATRPLVLAVSLNDEFGGESFVDNPADLLPGRDA